MPGIVVFLAREGPPPPAGPRPESGGARGTHSPGSRMTTGLHCARERGTLGDVVSSGSIAQRSCSVQSCRDSFRPWALATFREFGKHIPRRRRQSKISFFFILVLRGLKYQITSARKITSWLMGIQKGKVQSSNILLVKVKSKPHLVLTRDGQTESRTYGTCSCVVCLFGIIYFLPCLQVSE